MFITGSALDGRDSTVLYTKGRDTIVYTTVDKGLAFEVSAYLDKLKRDLCIGKDGYPDKMTLTGDQETHKIIFKTVSSEIQLVLFISRRLAFVETYRRIIPANMGWWIPGNM